jgi:hypothetical protein
MRKFNARPWSDAEIRQLRSLAGKLPRDEIAKQLGRSSGATQVQASKLGVSLRKPVPRSLQSTMEPGPTGLKLEV